MRKYLDRIEQTLTIPAAEYVPAIGDVFTIIDEARRALDAAGAAPTRLWLWKNFVGGRPEYWAFDNAFPINLENGDPQTLGEPCGYAIVKPSRQGRTDVSDEQVLRRIAGVTTGKAPIPDCGEAGHDDGCCGNLRCLPRRPEPSGETMEQREEVCAAWCALPDDLRKDARLTRLYHALGGPRMDDPAEAGPHGVTHEAQSGDVENIFQEAHRWSIGIVDDESFRAYLGEYLSGVREMTHGVTVGDHQTFSQQTPTGPENGKA